MCKSLLIVISNMDSKSRPAFERRTDKLLHRIKQKSNSRSLDIDIEQSRSYNFRHPGAMNSWCGDYAVRNEPDTSSFNYLTLRKKQNRSWVYLSACRNLLGTLDCAGRPSACDRKQAKFCNGQISGSSRHGSRQC